MASDATKSHIFSTIIPTKNTHKIIIYCCGYIYFWSKFLNIAKMPNVFAEVGVGTHIKYAKKMKKFPLWITFPSSKAQSNIFLAYLI
jgi:hypothetical protein